MKRRDFSKVLAGGSIGAVAAGCEKPEPVIEDTATKPKKKALMHVGTQHYRSPTKKNLEYLVRHGVFHCCAHMGKISPDGAWDIDEMRRVKDICEKHGVMLENASLGLSPGEIDRQTIKED